MALDPSGNFEFQQGGAYDRRRSLRKADQVINRNGSRSEKGNNPVAVVGCRLVVFLQCDLGRFLAVP